MGKTQRRDYMVFIANFVKDNPANLMSVIESQISEYPYGKSLQ